MSFVAVLLDIGIYIGAITVVGVGAYVVMRFLKGLFRKR